MPQADDSLRRLVDLSRQILICADEGDLCREDDRCGVIFGMSRDSAYRIIADAEKELERHAGQS